MLLAEKIEVKESKKAKHIRLAVCFNGSVKATKPLAVNYADLEKFIQQKMPWIEEKLKYFEKIREQTIFLPKIKKADYADYKQQAEKDIKARLEKINEHYGFSFNQVKVKNQKTRWGSCSNKSNLNFNMQIVFLENDLADYIIAHELCHLQQKNHSLPFWQLVSQTIPDYRQRRKQLRKIHLA